MKAPPNKGTLLDVSIYVSYPLRGVKKQIVIIEGSKTEEYLTKAFKLIFEFLKTLRKLILEKNDKGRIVLEVTLIQSKPIDALVGKVNKASTSQKEANA